MKVLTKNPGLFLSQYSIYDKILNDYDIKDPVEKDNFKFRFLAVLRQMSNLFEGISIMKKEDVIFVGFDVKDDKNDYDYEYSTLNEEIKKNGEMPPEISVINFIIDENMINYINRKDYKGNNVFHNLVIVNDIDRIKKCFSVLLSKKDINHLLFDINNEGLTPIHYIQKFEISNFFMSHILYDLKEKDDTIDLLIEENNIQTELFISKNKNNDFFLLFIIIAFFFQMIINIM
jgi:hypothetical protein